MNSLISAWEVNSQNPLETPENFPALPSRKESEREFLAWRYESLEVFSSWSIFRSSSPEEYIVRRLEYDPKQAPRCVGHLPDIYGAESPLAAEIVNPILESFRSLRVPMFLPPPVSVALDGSDCGVQFGNAYQGTRVHWWSASSEEWKPLVGLFERTIAILDAGLPASTLRELPQHCF